MDPTKYRIIDEEEQEQISPAPTQKYATRAVPKLLPEQSETTEYQSTQKKETEIKPVKRQISYPAGEELTDEIDRIYELRNNSNLISTYSQDYNTLVPLVPGKVLHLRIPSTHIKVKGCIYKILGEMTVSYQVIFMTTDSKQHSKEMKDLNFYSGIQQFPTFDISFPWNTSGIIVEIEIKGSCGYCCRPNHYSYPLWRYRFKGYLGSGYETNWDIPKLYFKGCVKCGIKIDPNFRQQPRDSGTD